MEESFVAVPVSEGRTRQGALLRSIFTAESATLRARGLRILLVGLLAILGVPLWVALIWPASISPGARLLVETVWALAFAGVGLALLWEAWWRRQRARHIAKLGPLPVLRTPVGTAQACASAADEED